MQPPATEFRKSRPSRAAINANANQVNLTDALSTPFGAARGAGAAGVGDPLLTGGGGMGSDGARRILFRSTNMNPPMSSTRVGAGVGVGAGSSLRRDKDKLRDREAERLVLTEKIREERAALNLQRGGGTSLSMSASMSASGGAASAIGVSKTSSPSSHSSLSMTGLRANKSVTSPTSGY